MDLSEVVGFFKGFYKLTSPISQGNKRLNFQITTKL